MNLNAAAAETWFDLKPEKAKAFMPLPSKKGMVEALRKPGGRLVSPEAPESEEETLRKAAKDFESVFLFQMLKQIRDTVHKEEFLGGGNAEEMFTGMLDEELAKVMAGSNSTGLAEMIYQQMRRMQGGGSGEAQVPGMPATTPQASALRDQVRDLADASRSLDAASAAETGSRSGR